MTNIKRLNYFTSQFLGERDFIDEQAYHLEMRRRHNRLLHSWGVADGGFQVTKVNDKTIAVSAGTAIDKDGREIVLLDTVPLDLSKFAANKLVYVTARYEDKEWDEADKDAATGHYTRRPEKAKIEPNPTPPATDGSVIPLAEVKLDGNGNIESPINSVRKTAGSRGDATVQSLTVEGDATLKKTLRVEGSINFGQRDNELLTLWDPGCSIGIQKSTVYTRSYKNFAWFSYGKHSSGEIDPGDGGTTMMSLTNGTLTVSEKFISKGLTITGADPLKTTAGANTLDVQRVQRTNPENHPKDLALYVTGPAEFRLPDGTQGIGFNWNSIYATGSKPNQDMSLDANGGNLLLNAGDRIILGGTGGNLQVGGGAVLMKTLTVEGDATLKKSLTITGALPVQTTGGKNMLDLQSAKREYFDIPANGFVPAFKGEHPTGLALYVTANSDAPGKLVEFRHSRGTAGIGFTHNKIYATGSDPNQPLRLEAKGTGRVEIKQEEWLPVSVGGIAGFNQGWANYGGVFTPAGYFKDSLGIVHLRGLVQRKSGDSNVIFTLPTGYRPEYEYIYAVASGHTLVPCRIDLTVKGEILVTAGTPGEYVSLDGISFRAA